MLVTDRAPTSGATLALALACLAAACGPIAPPAPAPGTGVTHHVVAIGDSYGSGQGAPDAKINWFLLRFHPRWDDDKRCNRSLNAGTSQAVSILRRDPAFANDLIKYQSFACSGASIEKGLLGPYRGTEPPSDPADLLRPQVDALRALAQTQTIDALTITVGGNDVLFEYIVAACILGVLDCDIIDPIVTQRLAELDGRLKRLADALATVAIPPDRVFVAEYPDPARASATAYCDRRPRGDLLSGISGCESRWASECVLPRLNHALCVAAQQHGWHYVGGIAAPFVDHGWCASDNWINTISESLDGQGHYRGGVHPNVDGYRTIGGALAGAIRMRLIGSVPPTTCGPPPVTKPECVAPCGVVLPWLRP
jgi:lysophospholipase L1-like esterase